MSTATYFDTEINRCDGSISSLTITQADSRVVLDRADLASLIRRINGNLIYVNGEFQLAAPGLSSGRQDAGDYLGPFGQV